MPPGPLTMHFPLRRKFLLGVWLPLVLLAFALTSVWSARQEQYRIAEVLAFQTLRFDARVAELTASQRRSERLAQALSSAAIDDWAGLYELSGGRHIDPVAEYCAQSERIQVTLTTGAQAFVSRKCEAEGGASGWQVLADDSLGLGFSFDGVDKQVLLRWAPSPLPESDRAVEWLGRVDGEYVDLVVGPPDLVALRRFRYEQSTVTGDSTRWRLLVERFPSGFVYGWALDDASLGIEAPLTANMGMVVAGSITMGLLILVLLMSRHLARPLSAITQSLGKPLDERDAAFNAIGQRGDEIGRLGDALRESLTEDRIRLAELERKADASVNVEDEIGAARTIQTSLLPDAALAVEGRRDLSLAALNRPAKQVGGDFYDFFWLNDNDFVLVIGDVAGKGVPASLTMAVSRTVVRRLFNEGLSPAEVLAAANRVLVRDTPQAMYVTLFVAILSLDSGRLVFANGAHVSPWMMSPDGVMVDLGEATGTLVGAFVEAEFTEKQVIVEPEHLLIMFTDGLSEARDPTGAFIDRGVITHLLTAYSDAPVHFLLDLLSREIRRFQASDPADDLTLLMLRRHG